MEYPKRKVIRLPDYDYSTPGAYFVTICTQDRRRVLSEIVVGDGVPDIPCVRLLPAGRIVEETLQNMVRQYPWLVLENHVIMPNHIHLLLRLEEEESRDERLPTHANERLPMLVSTLKRFSNKKSGRQLWQRAYHEHVIRNEKDFCEIWAYIDTNPAKWAEDCYYTD